MEKKFFSTAEVTGNSATHKKPLNLSQKYHQNCSFSSNSWSSSFSWMGCQDHWPGCFGKAISSMASGTTRSKEVNFPQGCFFFFCPALQNGQLCLKEVWAEPVDIPDHDWLRQNLPPDVQAVQRSGIHLKPSRLREVGPEEQISAIHKTTIKDAYRKSLCPDGQNV